MPSFPSPFGGSAAEAFDDEGSFVAEHLPEPGPFLTDHDVLAGDEHVAVHQLARELFEERGVYDATFGYNLARLNLDARHPNAGYRYAEETAESADGDELAVLRAEFTPTTEFCPQTTSLTTGSFRAFNGESDRHEYDLVRVRAAPMHHRAESINERLAELESEVLAAESPENAFGGPSEGTPDEPADGALGDLSEGEPADDEPAESGPARSGPRAPGTDDLPSADDVLGTDGCSENAPF